MSDNVTPDLQPTVTKRRSRNKLWLFLVVGVFLLFIIASTIITMSTFQMVKKSREIQCKEKFKQLSLALKQYAMDYADRFPNGDGMEGLKKLHVTYLPDSSLSHCLSDQTFSSKLNNKNIQYVYCGGFMDLSCEHGSFYDYPILFDRPGNNKEHIDFYTETGHIETLTTKAKNCSEFIEELNKQFKYPPELLKKLREKAAEADRRYSQAK